MKAREVEARKAREVAEAQKNIAPSKPSVYKEPGEKLLTGIKMQAVEDIMVAIGLNDRFLFTRELFNNDSELFKSTINSLNKQASWDDAVAYLNEKFSWNPNDPTLILFLSFVRRRFI